VIAAAHVALRNYQEGDYLLLVGDPMLCGIVMAVALEFSDTGVLNILRWNNIHFKYEKAVLDFSLIDPEEDNDNPELEIQ
jgi:hypothetical protein